MKSNIKKRRFLVILGIVIALLSISINNFSEEQRNNNDKSVEIRDETELKTANSEITIVTPEDKIYTKPMNGYYPATYGFENDTKEQPPTGWDDLSGINCYFRVFDSYKGHNKGVKFYDKENDKIVWARNDFGPVNSGTIEFWVAARPAHDLAINLRSGGIVGPNLLIDAWSYYYLVAGAPTPIQIPGTYEDLSWHHHRIDFNCTTDRFDWYIDNEIAASNCEFFQDVSILSSFHIYTAPENYDPNNPVAYVDSVGYSWDDDYEIGDNFYEGLLLSFDLEITPDWLGYSLNGQATKTIFGNTTIPMPADGPHTIQLFGNETGTMYKSDIRNFVVSIFNIITPENKRYTEPMSGYYPATYGFEDTPNGDDPLDWSDPDNTWKVIDEFNGHKKVYNCYGTHTTLMQEFIGGPRDNGTVECWAANENTATDPMVHSFQIRLFESSHDICVIALGAGGKILYLDNTGWHDTGLYALNNTWYHIRMDFEATNGGYMGLLQYQWYLYINGNQFGPFNFINNFKPSFFRSWSMPFSHNRYLDAVGYSWDPDYEIGDNLKEGLLLSFNCEMELDWIAYSLDGQEYVPIIGNTTIPMPADGLHTIQVFGDVYTSQVRPFIIGFPGYSIVGDDDDDDDDEEEIEFLGPTLIIIGIGSAIGVTAIAIYLIKKRKLVRE